MTLLTTYDYYTSAMSGFNLLALATKPQQRRDILNWITRDLTTARSMSTSAAFRAKCDDKLAQVEAQQLS